MQDLVGAGLDANAHFAAATAWVSHGVRVAATSALEPQRLTKQ